MTGITGLRNDPIAAQKSSPMIRELAQSNEVLTQGQLTEQGLGFSQNVVCREAKLL